MWPQRKRSETGRAPGLLSARDLLMHKARAESILHTSRSLGAQQHHARSLRGSLIRFQAQMAQFTQQAKPHTPRGYPSRLGREEKTIKMRDETDAGCCWGRGGVRRSGNSFLSPLVFRDVLSPTERGLATLPSTLQRDALPFHL